MLAGRHGQIRRQLQEVRGGLRAVGRGDPLVKLGKLQPALAKGNSQMRDSLLALPVTDPQLRTALGFGGPSRFLGRSHLSTLTSRAAVPYVPSHSCFGTNCAAHLGPYALRCSCGFKRGFVTHVARSSARHVRHAVQKSAHLSVHKLISSCTLATLPARRPSEAATLIG